MSTIACSVCGVMVRDMDAHIRARHAEYIHTIDDPSAGYDYSDDYSDDYLDEIESEIDEECDDYDDDYDDEEENDGDDGLDQYDGDDD